MDTSFLDTPVVLAAKNKLAEATEVEAQVRALKHEAMLKVRKLERQAWEDKIDPMDLNSFADLEFVLNGIMQSEVPSNVVSLFSDKLGDWAASKDSHFYSQFARLSDPVDPMKDAPIFKFALNRSRNSETEEGLAKLASTILEIDALAKSITGFAAFRIGNNHYFDLVLLIEDAQNVTIGKQFAGTLDGALTFVRNNYISS
jgi:hypothetical protein